jgi:hypothetical protein
MRGMKVNSSKTIVHYTYISCIVQYREAGIIPHGDPIRIRDFSH